MSDQNYSFYIDFDGVILDTMKIYHKIYEENNLDDFLNIFDYASFDEIIHKKYEINNSLDILRKVQNKSNIFILTKVNGSEEIKKKIDFLKEENISIPVIFVPFEKSKTEFVDINSSTILIDDDIKNIDEWTKAGGKTLLFSPTKIEGYDTIYSLDILLK